MGAHKDLALRSIILRFAEWRRSRKCGECIPDVLWDEVHALECQIGRTRLTRELGLNGAKVSFQMLLRGSAKSSVLIEPVTPKPGSNEPPRAASKITPPTVSITKVVSVPFGPAQSSAAAVEIESPSGWVMRLQADAAPEFLRAFVEATSAIRGGA